MFLILNLKFFLIIFKCLFQSPKDKSKAVPLLTQKSWSEDPTAEGLGFMGILTINIKLGLSLTPVLIGK